MTPNVARGVPGIGTLPRQRGTARGREGGIRRMGAGKSFAVYNYKKSPRGLARLLLVVRGKLRPCGSETTPNGDL